LGFGLVNNLLIQIVLRNVFEMNILSIKLIMGLLYLKDIA